MALSLRKKKPTAALVPVNSEEIMRGEPSLQTAKLDMTLQVLSLFIAPLWKQYQPVLALVKLAGVAIPDQPDQLISALLQSQNDAHMRSSVLSACEIMRAAVDDQVSTQAFEEILLTHIAIIKAVNVVEEANRENRRVEASADSGQDRER